MEASSNGKLSQTFTTEEALVLPLDAMSTISIGDPLVIRIDFPSPRSIVTVLVHVTPLLPQGTFRVLISNVFPSLSFANMYPQFPWNE